jgi:hypothetical protein
MMSRPSIAFMFRRLGWLAAAAIVLGAAPPLLAHDMWIDPTTFFPEPGAVVGLRLRVGENLLGDPLPRDPALINQFVFEDGSGRRPVIGRDGADPAGFLRAGTSGVVVVGYRSNPSALEQTPEKFNQYLKEEGLDTVAALRARRNETGLKGREMFLRCAKSLVLTGPAVTGQGDRLLGLPLEIIAERNPYMAAIGQELPFRLLYDNRPLAGALMVAINRFSPAEKLTARTDSQGRVRFTLRRGGMWLVKAVHMVPAPAGADAEWASYWASLTFGLRDAF